MNNPKCPYCGGEMREANKYEETLWFYCRKCFSTSPPKNTRAEAYAAAMKWEKKCKTYAEDFKEHFGHSWNNKNNNWQCRGRLYNDATDCVNSPRYDCEACWNEEMEANNEGQ